MIFFTFFFSENVAARLCQGLEKKSFESPARTRNTTFGGWYGTRIGFSFTSLSSDASPFARAPAARRVFFFFSRAYVVTRRVGARDSSLIRAEARGSQGGRARVWAARLSRSRGRTRATRERLAAQTRAFKPAFELAFGPTSKARYACPSRRLIGLLGGLVDERLVDVGDHTTTGDGRLDQGVELLVTADGELEVAGRDALDLWVFGSRGRRRRSERVVVAVFRREKETDRKTFFERIQNASRRSVDRTRPRPRTETCR